MKRLALIVALIAGLCLPIHAHAASPYDGPPSDLKALESKLLASIATISCTYKKGIGFFGSYSLSQESKDKGFNSLIITNQSLIYDCIYKSGGSITIGFNGKTYSSTYSGFNSDGNDLATVISTLNPPTISLWDKYWPNIGGWVYVAYYVEGYGIIFRSSRVQLINEALYVLAIDNITPVPLYGGIVFNSDGNFVGTIASIGPGTAPAGMLKVAGAPLQCRIAGVSSGTITNCLSTSDSIAPRSGVWTINPPSGVVAVPTPTPTPTQQVINSRELKAAQDAALRSLNLYDKAVENCFAEFTNMTEEQASEVNIMEIFGICSDYAADAEVIRGSTEDFDLTNKDVPGGVRALNKYASDADNLTKKVNANRIEVSQSITNLISINSQLLEMKEWLDATAEQWAIIENRLPSIPKTNQSLIQKNSEFKKAQAVVNQIDSVRDKIDSKLESLTRVKNAKEVKAALASLNSFKSSLKSYQNFSTSVLAVEKLIPENVCIKGSLISVTPKSGKCAKGYTKTSTR
jgi:hypothetical protein